MHIEGLAINGAKKGGNCQINLRVVKIERKLNIQSLTYDSN